MCRCGRERRVDTSDVTEKAWAILQPVIRAAKPGGRTAGQGAASHHQWEYVPRSGGPWRVWPHDFPNWRTVSLSFREWTQAGVWEQVHAGLRRHLRVVVGREPEPRAAMLESHSITTRAVRGDIHQQ